MEAPKSPFAPKYDQYEQDEIVPRSDWEAAGGEITSDGKVILAVRDQNASASNAIIVSEPDSILAKCAEASGIIRSMK